MEIENIITVTLTKEDIMNVCKAYAIDKFDNTGCWTIDSVRTDASELVIVFTGDTNGA